MIDKQFIYFAYLSHNRTSVLDVIKHVNEKRVEDEEGEEILRCWETSPSETTRGNISFYEKEQFTEWKMEIVKKGGKNLHVAEDCCCFHQ